MADLNIQPVATQIRPVQPMSLADMVAMARGVQAYQQEQQVNPLLLQLRQQEARTGQIALGLEEQKNIERQGLQKFFANPENFQTDGRIDINKINAAVPRIAPLTGAEVTRTYSDLSKAQSQAIEAKQNLTQGQLARFGGAAFVLGRSDTKTHEAYNKAFDDVASFYPDDPNVKKLADAYKVILGKVPASMLPDAAVKGAQTLLPPATLQEAFRPTVTATAEGRTLTMQPQPGVTPPSVTVGTAGGLQPAAAPSPAGPARQVAPGMSLPYPVRSAAQPFMYEPNEQEDQKTGITYRSNLQDAQSSLISSKRNTEEVVKQAKKIEGQIFNKEGGLLAQAEQKARLAIGSAEYDMLAKDLANMALSNAKALGSLGTTVAGLNMQEVANGTIKVPPGVLVNIARRVQADQLNIDMQARGAQQFSSRFGDNNLRMFRDTWARNGESKIFEAMTLMNEISDVEKLNKELKRLFPNPKEYETFGKKYRNIKSLTETGVTKE